MPRNDRIPVILAQVGHFYFGAVGQYYVGANMIMADWALMPEDESRAGQLTSRSIALTSALAFFILEMADKTQLAVVTLAGWRFAAVLPMRALRITAAALFALLGSWLVLDALGRLPDIGLPSPGRWLEGFGPG
ncbi:MAG: hypothetical protein JJT85_03135 [Chromatiales bacterium]|nr:hypothetical protein [Chromatiales bacterium]